jgi:hypothetical protein
MNPETLYVIWSEEHQAWWLPNAAGYTRELVRAGRYSRAAAETIVTEANRYLRPPLPWSEFAIADPLRGNWKKPYG